MIMKSRKKPNKKQMLNNYIVKMQKTLPRNLNCFEKKTISPLQSIILKGYSLKKKKSKFKLHFYSEKCT